ncbi:MAG: 3-phosphoshikimate 1-carboxyvinyltransferase [Bdellovibrionales bacterium]|nr:3-phosphoshikimate 1-carboxyvinyltransferase [Bdellovibrionales bacterium]
MSGFRFDGVIPASKSLFNRALICASYGDDVILHGDSSCDDVVKMKAAIHTLGSGHDFDCGSAGTVLRFLALRVSRIPGRHVLRGTTRLFSRPQNDLQDILNQLGVNLVLHTDHMIVQGDGWRPQAPRVRVSRKNSSQFVSGLLLNAWNLEFPLEIEWDEVGVSDGYWQMTVRLVKEFGMNVCQTERGVQVPERSEVKLKQYQVESDLSSAFAIAAYAALNGEAIFRHFPFSSLQPDKVFVSVLEEMGAGVHRDEDSVRIFQKGVPLKGIHWNLNDCPDLFPVLATLCAFASGPSRLDGAPHLVFKESNRIAKTSELLIPLGVETKILSDGMEICPPGSFVTGGASFKYDTDHDHRLAFAAALVASQRRGIEIQHPEVVNKSFPEFWNLLTCA